MITYPDDLPCFSATYNYAQSNTISTTEFQSGFKRTRRRFKEVPVTFSLSTTMNNDQLAVFESWRYNVLEDVRWFDATLKTGQGLEDWTVRFTDTAESKVYNQGFWDLSFIVEARKNRYLDLETLVKSLRDNNSVYGLSDSATAVRILPEINTPLDERLYPADDVYPDNALTPAEGYYPEYTFSLSFSYDASSVITTSAAASAGATSISINAIQQPDESFSNSNPWDYSQGARPEYEDAYSSAVTELSGRLNINPSNSILIEGDSILIGAQIVRLTQTVSVGDTVLYFDDELKTAIAAGTQIK